MTKKVVTASRERVTRSHDWTGPDRVNRHVHCANCGKIFEILKAKGECPGKRA